MPLHQQPTRTAAHPAIVRFLHWLWVYAIGCMVFSGWQIYNASPSLPFNFPRWTGLGGWLGGALAWHMSAMWLLALAGIARSEEHTSELQSRENLVCRLLLEKKKKKK